MRKYMVIGRRGSSHDNEVDIDFLPYGARDYGISRLHAVILVSNGRLVMKDINSTNGTQVNGQALPPLESCPLEDGDELLLGKMRVRVEFLDPTGD